ncbi:MAG TPA: hypothetical protein VFY54_12220, partial [Rubrobacter sp.]|nr:hypothetical protein [Rubrobacter sp.]
MLPPEIAHTHGVMLSPWVHDQRGLGLHSGGALRLSPTLRDSRSATTLGTMATQEERLAELAGQVERGLKRCLRTLQNLGSTSTNVEDLPAEAARVANELEDSRRALRELTERLGKLYDKAVRAFED